MLIVLLSVLPVAPAGSLDFSELTGGDTKPPGLRLYQARDGTELGYRYYPADSPPSDSNILVLLHGSAADSRYLQPLAEGIADASSFSVVTPDLRGHGPDPERRGDIDYIGQLEEDLADLIAHLRERFPQVADVVLAGHSSGGGLALRFAGGERPETVAGYLLMAPYLGDYATTNREDSGWATPALTKIIPISLLNQIGISAFNDARVLTFSVPSQADTEQLTPAYSYRLMEGFAPRDYEQDLAAVSEPLLVLVGADDEAMHASEFRPVIQPLAGQAVIETVAGQSHLGIISSTEARQVIMRWLDRLE